DFIVMQVGGIKKSSAADGADREPLVHGMIAGICHAVVVRSDGGRAAVFGPSGNGSTLAVKNEQGRLLTHARCNHETTAAVVNLARGFRLHSGRRCRYGHPDAGRTGNSLRLIGA